MKAAAPFPAWLRRLGYYGLALLLVASGAATRVILVRLVGLGLPPYLTFYPFVMLAALIGGWGPGIVATVAAAVVVDYWLLPSAGLFKIESYADAVALAFFAIMGVFMSLVAGLYRRMRDHLEELVVVRNSALRESEERLRFALQSARMGMWDWDLSTGRGRVTPENQRIFGLPEDVAAPTQEDYARLIHPEDLPRVTQAFVSAAQTRGHYEQQYRIRRADGSERWIHSAGHHIVLPDGRPHFVGVSYDITESKRTEEALREWNVMLESKVARRTAELEHRARQLQQLTLELSQAEERERERVAQILHDDLQQIMAAAKFQVGLLHAGTHSPEQSREILGHVQEMLKDAIEKSRHLSHELSPGVLRQGDLVETFDWLAEQMQAKHGLTVRVEAAGAVQARSDAVKTLVYRAAQEMLFNVVKHAGVREARLRVRRLGRYLGLSVSDRGRGLDPQEIRETTGLGLLSIRERVASLGGRMTIRGARGRGATFRIIVPDAESPANGAPVEPDSTSRTAPNRSV